MKRKTVRSGEYKKDEIFEMPFHPVLLKQQHGDSYNKQSEIFQH